jgi:hypothetical protein
MLELGVAEPSLEKMGGIPHSKNLDFGLEGINR